MAPTPEGDDHETAGTAESPTASQPPASPPPASPTRKAASTTTVSPPQQHQQAQRALPPPPPYPYPPYPGAHPFLVPPGYPPFDPHMPPPPPNPDGSFPPPMMYGYPPPPGAVQHHPGNPQAPPMPMYWHPSWGPPPPFEGRWMMPPPLPGQETQYDHLRRPGEPVPKRRRMTEGMSTEGEEGKIAKKKIDVACRFCRERKLRCDGNRPQCGNCSLRERDCFYQPGPPNRRGPGRKSKQMASGGASTGPNSPLAPISTITSQISTSPRTSASQPPSPTKPVQFRMENGQKKKEK